MNGCAGPVHFFLFIALVHCRERYALVRWPIVPKCVLSTERDESVFESSIPLAPSCYFIHQLRVLGA
jgi:hypothetical protein